MSTSLASGEPHLSLFLFLSLSLWPLLNGTLSLSQIKERVPKELFQRCNVQKPASSSPEQDLNDGTLDIELELAPGMRLWASAVSMQDRLELLWPEGRR